MTDIKNTNNMVRIACEVFAREGDSIWSMIAPLPSNEAGRLDALKRYDILDTAPEQAFDDITLLASQICKTDVATITFIDRGRRWFNLPDVSSRN